MRVPSPPRSRVTCSYRTAPAKEHRDRDSDAKSEVVDDPSLSPLAMWRFHAASGGAQPARVHEHHWFVEATESWVAAVDRAPRGLDEHKCEPSWFSTPILPAVTRSPLHQDVTRSHDYRRIIQIH